MDTIETLIWFVVGTIVFLKLRHQNSNTDSNNYIGCWCQKYSTKPQLPNHDILSSCTRVQISWSYLVLILYNCRDYIFTPKFLFFFQEISFQPWDVEPLVAVQTRECTLLVGCISLIHSDRALKRCCLSCCLYVVFLIGRYYYKRITCTKIWRIVASARLRQVAKSIWSLKAWPLL